MVKVEQDQALALDKLAAQPLGVVVAVVDKAAAGQAAWAVFQHMAATVAKAAQTALTGLLVRFRAVVVVVVVQLQQAALVLTVK